MARDNERPDRGNAGEGRRGADRNFSGRPVNNDRDGKKIFNRRDKDDRSEGRGERRSFDSGAGRRDGGERRSFNSDRPNREGGERRSFNTDRPDRREGGGQRAYGNRREDGERKPFNGERKPYGTDRPDRRESGERRSFGGDRREGGEKRSFGSDRREGGERRSFGNDRRDGGERRSFDSNRPGRDGGERRPYNADRPDRREGGEKRAYGSDRREGGERSFGNDRREGGEKRPFGNDRPRRDEGERRSYSPGRRQDDGNRSYGNDRRESGDRKPFGADRREGGDRPYSRDNKPSYGEKRSFGNDRGAKSSSYSDRKRPNGPSDENANEVPTTPTYNLSHYKDNPRIKKENRKEEGEDDGSIRLNRFIANAGICSRREADLLIEAGEIKVNGEVVKEMGFKVQLTDNVQYGKKILNREKLVYVLLNKPKDFLTTTDDPEGRKTVMDLVANASTERIFPVGRLDRNTTGLLLFTNDGELAQKLTHPSNGIKKIYQVELDKPLTKEDFKKIAEGVELEDGKAEVDDVALLGESNKFVGMEIHIGRNRIVRRIFEHLGYEVISLDRVQYAGLIKKDLPRSNWRYLSEKEVVRLKYFM
ncbi:pseudouridine synthase [Pontibacter sp. E15-1]|uniref:pseudouridine synthase n=1 Tax=Pontibacter sp. E15-1 TaxID=2919918 RepID=UPI001F4F29F1|nr:pseudouridine synthase [Pontibacter sp. E15-1]MCJ8163730.1 pseudouridine synthase [Pontibacter sp. E15-1]